MDDWLAELRDEYPDLIEFPDLRDALIGVAQQHTKQPLLVYDREKILSIRMRDGMTYEEADEFTSFNTDCLWAGEGTPLIMEPLPPQIEMTFDPELT